MVVAGLMPTKANAATLTFQHIFGGTTTTYTLTVEEGCTTDCDVKLEIDFSDPSAFDGTFLDAVQWQVDGSLPTDVDLDSTNAGSPGDWDVLLSASLNANECGGGAANGVCTEYDNDAVSLIGFEVAAGDSLDFNFLVDWAEPLVLGENLVNGNVRAAYNNADGKNFTIFSPGGGGFNEGGGGIIIVPEPATLALLGLGMLGVGYRSRRRSA
jgi:hypothetical protein